MKQNHIGAPTEAHPPIEQATGISAVDNLRGLAGFFHIGGEGAEAEGIEPDEILAMMDRALLAAIGRPEGKEREKLWPATLGKSFTTLDDIQPSSARITLAGYVCRLLEHDIVRKAARGAAWVFLASAKAWDLRRAKIEEPDGAQSDYVRNFPVKGYKRLLSKSLPEQSAEVQQFVNDTQDGVIDPHKDKAAYIERVRNALAASSSGGDAVKIKFSLKDTPHAREYLALAKDALESLGDPDLWNQFDRAMKAEKKGGDFLRCLEPENVNDSLTCGLRRKWWNIGTSLDKRILAAVADITIRCATPGGLFPNPTPKTFSEISEAGGLLQSPGLPKALRDIAGMLAMGKLDRVKDKKTIMGKLRDALKAKVSDWGTFFPLGPSSSTLNAKAERGAKGGAKDGKPDPNEVKHEPDFHWIIWRDQKMILSTLRMRAAFRVLVEATLNKETPISRQEYEKRITTIEKDNCAPVDEILRPFRDKGLCGPNSLIHATKSGYYSFRKGVRFVSCK